MTSTTVLFLLYDGVQGLDVTGPLEVFAGASRHPRATYDIRTASPGGSTVKTFSGLRLTPDQDLAATPAPDTLIVPGGEGALEPDPRVVAWLREHAPRSRRVVSVCTGSLLLAEAGLLRGRRATTHWAHADRLRAYDGVEVDADPIYIHDGDVYTSAGVTSGIDLALALVEEDLGRSTALVVARHLVVFLRRPGNQAQFSVQLTAQTARREPLRELQTWITEHPAADLSVESLAARAGLSPRHFARAFREETGMTPGRYVDGVRLECARRLLEDTTDGVERISRTCGYGTPEAMRRAFLRTLGTAPAEYRRRFRPASV
ncbi:HTH-type transcriptional activator RhaS [Streptomyces sp. RB5]|uniref:HTH-type transcriptional activator RhaS n=1 Tax=Streptomyces smaragdinus TaxID=2585196 RepID=A0A7K0CAW4_9ACTN|nr:GlxA family transcriptional regulator [Streptomyces smaragdinus]MQY10546.1 HTH-type transcriptional activator RhaS [Streptomyces smaragdinus]